MIGAQDPRMNPYVGPRSFKKGETLFGRNRERRDLRDLLVAERIVLLYSPSGAGKTSLIQAALIPELEKAGFRVLPVIRVGQEPPPDVNQSQAGFNRYVLSSLLSLEERRTEGEQEPLSQLAGKTFVDYLGKPAANEVLIFDQFDESLTVNPVDREAKEAFFAQVGAVLEAAQEVEQSRQRPAPERWALFAMREEYMPGLDPYLRVIPTRLKNTYRLDLLGVDAARQAIQQPARGCGVNFTDEAAEKLIDDLRRVRVQGPGGSTQDQPGLYVEPVQLQVVCHGLWQKLSADTSEIVAADVERVGDVDTALAGYYAERVKAAAAKGRTSERSIREWFEHQLITEQGIRSQVMKGVEASQGLDNDVIQTLEEAHLVRGEKRRGVIWFELAHDRLIEPVRRDNAEWFKANLSPLERQAALWGSQGKPRDLLLSGRALTAAERRLADHADEMAPVTREFLQASREARTRAQQGRVRTWAIAGLILMFIFAGLAGWGLKNANDARGFARQAVHNADDAQHQRSIAEAKAEEAQSQRLRTEAYAREAQHNADDAQHQRSIAEAKAEEAQSQRLRAEAYAREAQHNAAAAQHQRSIAEANAKAAQRNAADAQHQRSIAEANASDAQTQKSIANSRLLAVEALEHSLQQPDLALLLAMESVRTADTVDARRSLLTSLTSRNELSRFMEPQVRPVYSVAFSPILTKRTFASGGDNGAVILWEATTRKQLRLTGHSRPVSSVAFSPNGEMLASGGWDKIVIVWDVRTGKQVTSLQGHTGSVNSVAFSPDGSMLASGSDDKIVILWDAKTYQQVASLTGHKKEVTSVAFSQSTGKMPRLASGDSGGTIILWDIGTKQPASSFQVPHSSPVSSIAFAPNGSRLVSGSFLGPIILWDPDAAGGNPVTVPGSGSYGAMSLAFSRDGITMASGNRSRSITLWEFDGRGIRRERLFPAHSGEVYSVAFGGDPEMLVSGGADGAIILWDTRNPPPPRLSLNLNARPGVTPGKSVLSVAFARGGKTLASRDKDGVIVLWDVGSTPKPGPPSGVSSMAFSPDGSTLAYGTIDKTKYKTIALWNVRTHQQVGPLDAHTEPVTSLAFSPGGQTLASGDEGGSIILWKIGSGTPQQMATRLGHSGKVNSLAFSSDGKTLASWGNDDEFIILWDVRDVRRVSQG
jgi:WD40 repeat protein